MATTDEITPGLDYLIRSAREGRPLRFVGTDAAIGVIRPGHVTIEWYRDEGYDDDDLSVGGGMLPHHSGLARESEDYPFERAGEIPLEYQRLASTPEARAASADRRAAREAEAEATRARWATIRAGLVRYDLGTVPGAVAAGEDIHVYGRCIAGRYVLPDGRECWRSWAPNAWYLPEDAAAALARARIAEVYDRQGLVVVAGRRIDQLTEAVLDAAVAEVIAEARRLDADRRD
jgi:hypothetical protein